MNNVVLIGRLTRDPELRYMAETQTAMCTFTLAIDRNLSRAKREEMEQRGQQTADFIRIVAWGKTAELCGNYLQKGLMTAVQGRIQTGSYENQQGQRVYTTDVVAERVEFIEWPDRAQSQSSGYNQYNQSSPYQGGFSQDTGPSQGFGQDQGPTQAFGQDQGQEPSRGFGGEQYQEPSQGQKQNEFDDADDDFMPYGDDSKIPF